MALQPGTRLGNYEITGQIGAGGMGEVYKARDPRLNRLVAIKVLPPSLAENRDFLARFDREAKAVAALSHPNVLGIHDLATQDGLTYAVMELLEGDSLRDRLKTGALTPKRALEIAIELAQGLGAAHAQGIIHRDVKPENIFITKDGRVKVLDFGLAKQMAPPKASANLATEALSLAPNGTEAGLILGTAGYMSPEQVRGEAVDARSDIFAFGVVLYELLSGQRPFKGETPVQTMAAILDEEPPTLTAARGPLPPALERLVAHCLEKQPEARFQSMKDVAFALQNLSTQTTAPAGAVKASRPNRPTLAAGLLGAALVLALGGLLWGLHLPPFHATPPTFTRLTFVPGTVESAFFGPDGRTVFFSERIQGRPSEIFVIRPDSPEPKPLGVTDAKLLAVAPDNELAILRGVRPFMGSTYQGMLAQVNGGGGSARDIQSQVSDAGWDGPGLALLGSDDRHQWFLEFPAGKVLFKVDATARNFRLLRVAQGGGRLALVESDTTNKTEVALYDRSGRRTVIFTKLGDANGDTLTGLAWGPGETVWISELSGDQTDVWALSLGGRRRLLWRGEGAKALMDVAADGRMLLADHQMRRSVLVQRPGQAQATDLSVAGSTQGVGMSEDGRALLLLESPILDGGTHQDLAYLNQLDGSPALKLAKGTAQGISADGRWLQLQYSGFTPAEVPPAIAAAFSRAGLAIQAVLDPVNPLPYLLFVPTGAERPFAVALPRSMVGNGYAFLHPDGRRILVAADENDQSYWFVMDRQGGPLQKVTRAGLGGAFSGLQPLSPDGRKLLVGDGNHHFFLQSLEGGDAVPIRGLQGFERPVGWSRDSHSIYACSDLNAAPILVWRLDPDTGARTEVFHFQPGDASGLLGCRSIFTSLDAKVFALTYSRQLSQLYLVEGVR